MNVYDEILEPSVTHLSLVGHFTTNKSEEFVVAKTNILSVYRVTKDKLRLMYEWNLAGKIIDMQFIPQLNSNLKVLVILSSKSKISLVRFDEGKESLETLSLHYYQDKFESLSITKPTTETKMVIDPMFRCILIFNNDVLALLPLKGLAEEVDEDDENDVEHKTKKIKLEDRVTGESVVMPMSNLHKSLKHVYDIKFLENFSKPTLGILYQPILGWCGNEKLVKNTIRYMVLSLDVDDEKTTVISTLSNLPNDLHTMIPTRKGTILVGINVLLHINNSGELNFCIKINDFATSDINTRIVDRSKMSLFLTKNFVFLSKQLKNNDVLILMDEKCTMYNVIMEAEGRLVTKFDIVQIPIVNEIFKNNTLPLCISGQVDVDNSKILIGFQSGDAMFVQMKNLTSTFETKKQVLEIMDDDEDYDDLYGDSQTSKHNKVVEVQDPFDISLLDILLNVGPVTSLSVGKVASVEPTVQRLSNPNKDEFSIVATSGLGHGSHLTVLHCSVQPIVEQALKFTTATRIWNLKLKGKDKYLVTTDSDTAKSDVYQIDKNFEPFRSPDFRKNHKTINMATMDDDRRILQITTNGLYLFDNNFKRLARLTIDVEIIHASVFDSYILLTDARGNIKIYKLDPRNKKKFIKFKLPDALSEIIITSGSICKSNILNKFLHGLHTSNEEQMLFTFVTGDNQVIFFTEKHKDRIFQLCGIDQLEDTLFISTYQVPDDMNPDPSIKQIMLNKLGHNFKEEYLTVLTFGGEIYQYKKSSLHRGRFVKCSLDSMTTGAPNNAYPQGVNNIERVAHYFPDYNGYSVIFITGQVPYLVIKEDVSPCRYHQMANIPIVTMARWGKNSVMCVDNLKNARVISLDTDCFYGNKIVLRKIKIEDVVEEFETLGNIAYHERTGMYVISYTKSIEYRALSEDDEELVGYDSSKPNATGYTSGILLINPKTWNIIDRVDLPENSLVQDIKTMIIQLNSTTKRKREFVIVGNTYVKDEDQPGTGSIIVLDITAAVSEPGKPDTNFKFIEIFKEEIRGSVTKVSEISGRFMVGQSSKVLIRDMQEDNSAVPVAFLDMPIYITDAKSFSNLMIIGDAMQGFTFVGFDAEPYRMVVLGKSTAKFQVMCLEFIVNNGDANFLVSDRNGMLHVLKFAPDEPNSLSGQRLVHCNTFNLFALNTCLKLIPKNNEFSSSNNSFIAVGSQTDGSLFRIVPIDESAYRRLYLVQQQLIEKTIPLAGLNPRMERLDNEYYQKGHPLRPTLDFQILKKFTQLPIKKRTTMEKKVGRQGSIELWHDIIEIEYSLRSLTAHK